MKITIDATPAEIAELLFILVDYDVDVDEDDEDEDDDEDDEDDEDVPRTKVFKNTIGDMSRATGIILRRRA